MKFVLFALMLCLSACATVGQFSAEQDIATSCAVASAGLKTITVAAHANKITHAQWQAAVDAGREVAPFCAVGGPPTLDSLKLQAFDRAVEYLRIHAAAL